MKNENDSAQIIARKKRFASLLDKPTPEEKNTLNLMPEIKKISGDKAGEKILNRFLDTDKKKNFAQTKRILKGKENYKPYKFELVIPKGLNEQQEYVLQELYLKAKLVGNELEAMKFRKLPIAEVQKKILVYSKNMVIDFRKAKDLSNDEQMNKWLEISSK